MFRINFFVFILAVAVITPVLALPMRTSSEPQDNDNPGNPSTSTSHSAPSTYYPLSDPDDAGLSPADDPYHVRGNPTLRSPAGMGPGPGVPHHYGDPAHNPDMGMTHHYPTLATTGLMGPAGPSTYNPTQRVRAPGVGVPAGDPFSNPFHYGRGNQGSPGIEPGIPDHYPTRGTTGLMGPAGPRTYDDHHYSTQGSSASSTGVRDPFHYVRGNPTPSSTVTGMGSRVPVSYVPLSNPDLGSPHHRMPVGAPPVPSHLPEDSRPSSPGPSSFPATGMGSRVPVGSPHRRMTVSVPPVPLHLPEDSRPSSPGPSGGKGESVGRARDRMPVGVPPVPLHPSLPEHGRPSSPGLSGFPVTSMGSRVPVGSPHHRMPVGIPPLHPPEGGRPISPGLSGFPVVPSPSHDQTRTLPVKKRSGRKIDMNDGKKRDFPCQRGCDNIAFTSEGDRGRHYKSQLHTRKSIFVCIEAHIFTLRIYLAPAPFLDCPVSGCGKQIRESQLYKFKKHVKDHPDATEEEKGMAQAIIKKVEDEKLMARLVKKISDPPKPRKTRKDPDK